MFFFSGLCFIYLIFLNCLILVAFLSLKYLYRDRDLLQYIHQRLVNNWFMSSMLFQNEIYICYLPDGRSVLEKYFVEVSKMARGRRPRAVFETETKYFSSTDRPKR